MQSEHNYNVNKSSSTIVFSTTCDDACFNPTNQLSSTMYAILETEDIQLYIDSDFEEEKTPEKVCHWKESKNKFVNKCSLKIKPKFKRQIYK